MDVKLKNKVTAENQDPRPAKTQLSLGICTDWSKSSLCAQWVAKDPRFLHADSEDWSDGAAAQADLSLCWAQWSFCWFCHEAAHFWLVDWFRFIAPGNIMKVMSRCCLKHLSRLMTKPTKWHVRPAKTQISLGIRPVWSESSLSAWRNLGSLATYWAHSEDSDQTGRMPRLIWVVAGRTCLFIGFVMRRLISDWLVGWLIQVYRP